MLRTALWAVALGLCQILFLGQIVQPLALAQETSDPPSLRDILPERLHGLITGAPPEISAHALLSFAGRSGDLKPKERLVLYEEAYARAASAHEALPRHLLPGANVDNLYGMIDAASDLGLDRLTLQCNTVRGVETLDTRKALRMLLDISPAQIPALTCNDFVVSSVAAYYSTLGRSYALAVKEGDSKRAQDVLQALSARALAVSSILEVADLFDVLPTLGIPVTELAVILNGVTGTLANMPVDARSMSSAMPRLHMSVLKIALSTAREGIDIQRLLVELRGIALRSLNQPQCRGASEESISARYIVEPFNRLLAVYQKVLGEEAATKLRIQWPAGTESERYVAAQLPEFWQSENAKALQRATRELKRTPGSQSDAAQVSQIVEEITRWKAARDESELEVFHEASLLLRDLSRQPSLAEVRPAIVSAYCGYLSASSVLQGNPNQWYLHAKDLISGVTRSSERGEPTIDGCNTPQLELVALTLDGRSVLSGSQ